MNQTSNSENKLLTSLLKRLRELDQENQLLKAKLTNKSTQNRSHPYFQIKELIIANQEEQQICSLCNCQLDTGSVINSLHLYFCAGDCSLIMEKLIEEIVSTFRQLEKK